MLQLYVLHHYVEGQVLGPAFTTRVRFHKGKEETVQCGAAGCNMHAIWTRIHTHTPPSRLAATTRLFFHIQADAGHGRARWSALHVSAGVMMLV